MQNNTAENNTQRDDDGHRRRKLYIIGTGPGSLEQLTPAAKKAIENSTVVVGYQLYIELIEPLLENKEVISSGMRREIERCETAIKYAREGEVVSLISSGDPGIYGMAGPVFEILNEENTESDLEVEIVPGISAAQAAASLAGAPLMNDYAVISLSDLMTPWEVIEKRLKAAAEGDFVIVLYNPKSKKRTEQILRAKEIILNTRSQSLPVAIVENAYRENQKIVHTDINSFTGCEIGMLSVVIIGNSQTVFEKGKMVTARGYKV